MQQDAVMDHAQQVTRHAKTHLTKKSSQQQGNQQLPGLNLAKRKQASRTTNTETTRTTSKHVKPH